MPYKNMTKEQLIRCCEIKDAYCYLIRDNGLDYDGYCTTAGLKALIDCLVDYAGMAINNDDKSIIYNDNINILFEKI